ncbi:GATA transcription factor 16 [Solanum lycopersicum]|uniref:GATA-type domain-containing protein n=1 Tax=Solanum lycopersicum TaxID=4081 RepID=A0A3Q7F8I6_SOLLC|nr:GATA transcription factor 16 [Solanum lycopersicum]
MDPNQKDESSGSEATGISKSCSDCKTTKTPLWRSGPSGPKSLCNACGIKYRKKKSSPIGLTKGATKKKEKPLSNSGSTEEVEYCKKGKMGNGKKDGKLSKVLRVKLMMLGKEVVILQRQRSAMKKPRKLDEVERAAVLLMALSCGSVFG